MKKRLLYHIYLMGYGGHVPPRWLRRLLARTDLHRAWLSGHGGVFEENGLRYGPANPYPGCAP